MAIGKKTGGRQKGSLNRVTTELRDMARQHTTEALGVLVSIKKDTEATPQARTAAAQAILDRGHGKPQQTALVGIGGMDEIDNFAAFLARLDGNSKLLVRE